MLQKAVSYNAFCRVLHLGRIRPDALSAKIAYLFHTCKNRRQILHGFLSALYFKSSMLHSSFHSTTGVPSALNSMGSQMYRASLGCSGLQMSAMKM